MKRCLVIGAAPTALKIAKHPGDFLIAADGGWQDIDRDLIDLAVGDFDSLGFVPEGVEVVRHPVRKLDTDMMLGLREGVSRGYRFFLLYGGVGGRRSDHTIANIQSLAWLVSQGARGLLLGDRESYAVLGAGDVLAFPASSTGTISIFSYGEKAFLRLEGLDYPFEGEFSDAFPFGVSNHFVGKEGSVTVKQGRALVVFETASQPCSWRVVALTELIG